jgi:hypothetical protein
MRPNHEASGAEKGRAPVAHEVAELESGVRDRVNMESEGTKTVPIGPRSTLDALLSGRSGDASSHRVACRGIRFPRESAIGGFNASGDEADCIRNDGVITFFASHLRVGDLAMSSKSVADAW